MREWKFRASGIAVRLPQLAKLHNPCRTSRTRLDLSGARPTQPSPPNCVGSEDGQRPPVVTTRHPCEPTRVAPGAPHIPQYASTAALLRFSERGMMFPNSVQEVGP